MENDVTFLITSLRLNRFSPLIGLISVAKHPVIYLLSPLVVRFLNNLLCYFNRAMQLQQFENYLESVLQIILRN